MATWFRASVASLAMLSLALGAAFAQQASAPPPGWETGPELRPASSSSGAVACCAWDSDCCVRQTTIDRARVASPSHLETIDVSKLPEAVLRRAPKGGAVEGAPKLRLLDGRGQPAPWSDGPSGEVRFVPPGKLGDIHIRDRWEPCFEPKELRSQGFGIEFRVENGRAHAAGPFEVHSLSRGPGDTLAYEELRGAIGEDLSVTVTEWIHADAAPIVRGALFAFRFTDDAAEKIMVLGPEVGLGAVTGGVVSHGGFDGSSRFSRDWAFTRFAFPAAPGAAGLATFSLSTLQLRSLGAIDLHPNTAPFQMMVDVTRTSTEPSAHLRVHTFD